MPESMKRLAHPQSSSTLSIKIPLTQKQGHYAVCKETLLQKKILLVISITVIGHIILPFFTHSLSYFCGYELLIESTELPFIIHFSEFLTASIYKEIFSFIFTQPIPWEVLKKRSCSIFLTTEGNITPKNVSILSQQSQ